MYNFVSMIKRYRNILFSKTRLIVLAAVAVVLPTTTLSLVQYRSLVDLEDKTKAAVRENLRQTLQGVSRKVEEQFVSMAREALTPVGQIGGPGAEVGAEVESHFLSIKKSRPEIDQLFVISHCSCQEEKDKYAHFMTPEGLRRIEGTEFEENLDVQNALKSYEKASLVLNNLGGDRHLLYWQNSCAVCSNKSANHLKTYVFYVLFNHERREHVGLVGLTFNSDYVQNEYLAKVMSEALLSPDLSAAGGELAIGVLDERKQLIYGTAPQQKEFEIKMPFSRPFSNWEMGIAFRGTTIESLAAGNFRKNLLLSVIAASLLIIGILLTMRASARELGLAQAKSNFVSNVSHELKTPLALIRLFAETLELGRVKDAEKAREYYRIIGNESRRLSQLIDNVLDFAKIEAGRKQYQFAYADAGEIVEGVLSTYSHQIASAGFELTTRIEEGTPLVLVDRDALSQAVLNLLNNATKYADRVKRIEVGVRVHGPSLMIEVSDSGIGIPRSEQNKIFDKFYRVDAGLVHNTKGSGLGLALVKQIVEAHKGEVSVESAPGMGSRFTIKIPLTSPGAAHGEKDVKAVGYKVAESTHH